MRQRYLNQTEAAHELRVSVRTLLRWRQVGIGPRFVRAGATRVLYSLEELRAWAASQTFQSAAQEAVARVKP